MKEKILLFNYFLKKCVQKEQELLEVDSFSTGLLGLVLSHTKMVRRFANGCTSEEICFVYRYYPIELLLAVCLDAKSNGDNLLATFDFKQARGVRNGVYREFFVRENDLDQYLETVIPSVKSVDEIDYEAYCKVSGLSRDELIKKSFRLDNLCSINIENLDVAKECEQTKMIDRAWERLSKDERFINLFYVGSKHTPRSLSLALCYCTSDKFKAIFAQELGE